MKLEPAFSPFSPLCVQQISCSGSLDTVLCGLELNDIQHMACIKKT